jgi:hypothetical protein
MTLKATRGLRPTVIAATTLIVAAFAGLALAGSAFADHAWRSEPPTLNGDWAPLNRCPVDDPTMLAITGETGVALCIAESSPSGSMTIGNLTVPFKGTNHQYGVDQSRAGVPSPTVSPAGGVLVTEPVELPGGIRGLLCPSHGRVARHICRDADDRRWNEDVGAVTWTLESAGNLTNFRLFAGLVPGVPIATVPLKIHLQNRFLGNDCYIGSEAEPIVTQPASLVPPEVESFTFAGDGTPSKEGEEGRLSDIKSRGSQGASAFAVPAATGCGHDGFFDQAINDEVGLPSSASTNSLTFNEGTTNLVGLSGPENYIPNEGKDLSEFWHSAVLTPETDGHGHGHDQQQRGHRLWSSEEAEGYMRHKFRFDR